MFESGFIPSSADFSEFLPKLCIFDWGRSVLIDQNEFNDLSEDEQEDRIKYWG